MSSYSPRQTLFERYHEKELSPLASLAKEGKDAGIAKSSIQKDVYERLFCKQDDGASLLDYAITKAKGDVIDIISSASSNFIPNSLILLDKYIKEINMKINTYNFANNTADEGDNDRGIGFRS